MRDCFLYYLLKNCHKLNPYGYVHNKSLQINSDRLHNNNS